MAMEFTKDVSAYLEQKERYGTDNVKVELDEGTLTVTAYPADVFGNKMAGKADLVNKKFDTLKEAISHYEDIVHQLQQGDIIRNV